MRSGRSPPVDAPRTPRDANLVTAAGGDVAGDRVSLYAPRRARAMSPRTVPIFLDGFLALSAT